MLDVAPASAVQSLRIRSLWYQAFGIKSPFESRCDLTLISVYTADVTRYVTQSETSVIAVTRGGGGIGRRPGFRYLFPQGSVGSSPTRRTSDQGEPNWLYGPSRFEIQMTGLAESGH